MTDKKDYNHNYFQNNKQRIYANYKRRYHQGNGVLRPLNWYQKRKYRDIPSVLQFPPEQSPETSKIVQPQSIIVTFGFD